MIDKALKFLKFKLMFWSLILLQKTISYLTFVFNYCNFSSLAQENWDSYCSGTAGCSDDNYIEYNPDAECYEDELCLTTLLDHIDNLIDSLNLCRDAFVGCQNNQIFIDLLEGWNIIGYTHTEQNDAVTALEEIQDILFLIKNNNADFYMPEYGFNGIGDLIPGQGYQLKVKEAISGFTFPTTDLRINLTPSVPQWALDMDVELHPNDIRTLVRVVNELGQEVDPNSTPYGTVLFYIFNDATVEKRVNSKF